MGVLLFFYLFSSPTTTYSATSADSSDQTRFGFRRPRLEFGFIARKKYPTIPNAGGMTREFLWRAGLLSSVLWSLWLCRCCCSATTDSVPASTAAQVKGGVVTGRDELPVKGVDEFLAWVRYTVFHFFLLLIYRRFTTIAFGSAPDFVFSIWSKHMKRVRTIRTTAYRVFVLIFRRDTQNETVLNFLLHNQNRTFFFYSQLLFMFLKLYVQLYNQKYCYNCVCDIKKKKNPVHFILAGRWKINYRSHYTQRFYFKKILF